MLVNTTILSLYWIGITISNTSKMVGVNYLFALRGWFGQIWSKSRKYILPISADWFIIRITKVLNSDIYLIVTVAIVTTLATNIGLNREEVNLDQIYLRLS